MTDETHIQCLNGLQSLIPQFSCFIFDQWGVLHDGYQPYAGAVDLLITLKQSNKKIIVLSNSSRSAQENIQDMQHLGFQPNLFDAVVTSGEIFSQAWEKNLWPFLRKNVFHFDTFLPHQQQDAIKLKPVARIEQADWILINALSSTLSLTQQQQVLALALEKNIPLVCTNPDFSVIQRGSTIFHGPGKLARWYEEQGGEVFYFGKPYAPIYDLCRQYLPPYNAKQTLCVGDSLDHDILGAHQNGFPSLLLGQGVLNRFFVNNPNPLPQIKDLCRASGVYPNFYSYGL